MMTFRILVVSTFLLSTLAPALANDEGFEERVAELQAMNPAERKAALQAMTPEERRGLWFAVKKADRAERSVDAAASGFYDDAIRSRPENESRAAATAANGTVGTRAVGTITYDDGVISTTFGGGAIIGNRFNTHTGVPVLASGTVSTVIGVVQPGPSVTTSSAGFVLEGPQTTGGGAFQIFSSFTGGLTAATETVIFSGIGANYTGDSFFVLFGDFANSYVPAFGTGTTNGQGHHGVVGYTGGMGPNITSTFDFGGTLNGLVRAGGNILPVELMEYGVE
ncbi:MAG: hypothetical protein WD397_16315 [Wenzhouxiangellaceae bacterium]